MRVYGHRARTRLCISKLVHESNEAQQRMAQALDAAVAEIKSLRTRAESMEKLLQEVG